MKHNTITWITSGVLILIFGLMLFAFQVRETEVAVVTTFGKYSGSLTNAGLYGRWPWPVQSVYKFDKRIQNFERKYEQTTTADARNLVLSVFVGWRVADPKMFLERFSNGDPIRVGQVFEGLVSDVKNSVISKHPFGDLISTNQAELKFDQIELEMRDSIRPLAAANYGIHVEMVGIKQMGLPESITAKVFDRMRAERTRLVKKYQSEGEAKASEIKSDANRKRQETIASAESAATLIRGAAEEKASTSYAVFERNPELAIFLLKLRTLETSLTNRATMVLDQQTPPFDLLNQLSNPTPAKK
jgi:membrane protease subunit HflC